MDTYKEWQKRILEPHINNNINEQFSAVFLAGIPANYKRKGKKIMIIGQNGNSTTEYYSDNLANQLKWHGEYLDRQVYGVNNGEKGNSSPFWAFFRRFEQNGNDLIWNNINKIIKIKDNDIEELTVEDELALNSPYGPDKKSLLEREINILKPDALIFVTGPHYYYSMAVSLGIDANILKNLRPDPSKSLVELTDVVDLEIPILWTYHPGYLNRSHLFDENTNKIFDFLSKS